METPYKGRHICALPALMIITGLAIFLSNTVLRFLTLSVKCVKIDNALLWKENFKITSTELVSN